MQKEIGFYRDDSTPYKYSYSQYTKMWYNDEYEQMPEPDVQAEELTNFKLFDELGSCIWENGEWAFKEEGKADFERYIKFVCGEENDWCSFDPFTITIVSNSKKQERSICITFDELIYLEEFIKNTDTKDYSLVYCENYGGMKFFSFKKGNNKIRLLIQQYGLFERGYIDYDLLTVEYDIEIDNDEFVSEFMRVINKYKNLIIERIKEYEKKNNITFSNPHKIKYIDYWLKR